jgi:FMN phosphatase YigB (HAD superfamily)
MKKAFVFDFDDTLVKTDCKIIVKSDNITRYLTPAEFNHYIPSAGDVCDFSEFEYVINPVGLETLKLAKQVDSENHDVYILTARNNNAKNPIVEFVRSCGINAKEVYCVGDNGSDIAQEKRTVLLTIMQGYDKIYFYDDHVHNVEAAKEIGVKAYRV